MKRTCIYIDGFNLYYGSLKNTPYRWLNLKTLFENILSDEHQIQTIKYFTAMISIRDDSMAPIRQKSYLRALEAIIPELTIYYGHYLTHPVRLPLSENPKQKVSVLKSEEKGSDVNMAVQLLNDAWRDCFDCAIIVSNDSDLAESIRIVREEHNKLIGLVTPGDPKKRKTTLLLREQAHFIKRIRSGALKVSQLPEKIPNTNLYKPSQW